MLSHFLHSRSCSSLPYEICLPQLAGGLSRILYCCHYSQMSIIVRVRGDRGVKRFLLFASSIFLAGHVLRARNAFIPRGLRQQPRPISYYICQTFCMIQVFFLSSITICGNKRILSSSLIYLIYILIFLSALSTT